MVSALPLMNDATRQKVQEMFDQQLQEPLEVLLFHTEAEPGDDQFTSAAREILQELAALSGGRVQMRDVVASQAPKDVAAYRIDKFPALVFLDQNRVDQRIRFYGAPVGYEFMTLLDDIVDVSRHQTRLTDAARAEIQAIDQEVLIQVFSTPG